MSINNVNHLCINCMREKPSTAVCPYCGFDESQYEPSPHHLPPRSILGGKCLIGRVLGEGGFGITYLGWDLNLDLKLAIKEYYPTGYVTRTNTSTSTVTPYRGEKTEFFTTGRSRFINEAKTLAKYYTLPGIVSVRDFFLENGTAYIVMEFVEGETLKQRLARVGGKMEAGEIFELVRPLLRSLSEMHASGLIHRDISPDNIMITPENNIKLIDFGAARDYLDSGNKSLSVMLKPGFAPEEQYFARGQQGPWTDIYALCATIYRAITGKTPQESVERLRHDELQPPSALGARLTPAQETALIKGLSVAQEGRWQTVPELYAALYPSDGSVVSIKQPGKKEQEREKKPNNGADVHPRTEKAHTFGANEIISWGSALLSRWKAFVSTFPSPKHMIPMALAAVLSLVFFITLLLPNSNGTSLFQSASSPKATRKIYGPVITSGDDNATEAAQSEEAVSEEEEEDKWYLGLDQIFPIPMPERIPASEQNERFLRALDLINNDEYASAMLTYDFSQRISTGSDSSAVLGSDNIPVFSCKNSAAITRYQSIGSGVAIEQGMVAILHEDGTVSRADTTSNELSMFRDIVAISSNDYLLVGLKKDGTAVTYQQYDTEDYEDEVEAWTDLVSISVALAHTVGLRENGTVVAAGDHSYNACDVEDWSDIVRISTGTFFTAGLRADGTVITTDPSEYDTSSWANIIAIDASEHYLVGIDMSGKVHLAGYDAYTEKFAYVSSWKSLLATSKGSNFIIALGSDGMLHAYGDDEDMQYDLIVAEKYFPEISY